MGGGGGGGGGGGQQQNAEDLADLFELETDKMRNQYEQVQRGEQQQAQQQVDETLEKLKQLAARQQQENERARQRAQRCSSRVAAAAAVEASASWQTRRIASRGSSSVWLANNARPRWRRARGACRKRRMRCGAPRRSRDRDRDLPPVRRSTRSKTRGDCSKKSRQSGQTGSIEDAARRAQDLANQQREVAKDVQDLANAGASRA